MTEEGRPPGRRTRGAGDFDASYVSGTPPWDIGRPQAPFRELADRGRLTGRVLDVGCGTGEHALMAAALGLETTGVDTSPTAIALARGKATERGLQARFMTWNALDLPGLQESFDTVLDCGLFHVFDDTDRQTYVASLWAAMPVGAVYHVLCFSDLEPGEWGPRRVRESEIRDSFRDGWRVQAIERARLDVTIEPGSVHAWFASIERG